MRGHYKVGLEVDDGDVATLEAPIKEKVRSGNSGREKILVVDDEKEILEIYNDLLGERYKVFNAESGVRGWEEYIEHRPDLTITDFQMPNGSGSGLIKKILEWDGRAKIILASSTVWHAEDIGYYRDKGVQGFLVKPFHSWEVIEEVERVLDYKS